MPNRRGRLAVLGLLLAACAPKPVTTVVPPTMDPVKIDRPPIAVPTPPPEKSPQPAPSEASRRGLMPLASTGVWAFRQAHPTYDGRGVLIGILDSGIDPSIPGLGSTPTGGHKILDLRDFSGEGKVPLAVVTPKGDQVTVGATTLRGFRRVAGFNAAGPYYAGVIREVALGELPAADLNWDGNNTDELPIVVTKASDGWILFADTNGDGSLEDEKGIHDFLVARETFGWSTGGRASPLHAAANFGEEAGAPTLDIFFDTSGHGSHVSGIASGYSMYGVQGFDGVAPGAQLIGLKIANNAYGGISMTGTMRRALAYAIEFAKKRGLPLVLNMSFGVGNEKEGTARIDAVLDSALAANPDVTFVTSAGNDGPGISTMGFPATANRVITVGATYPPAFSGGVAGDVTAFFSSRGGEVAKPDLLAPGLAYSTVPRWDAGSEIKSGTSMASPHMAGAVALLVSGARQEKRTVSAEQIKRALLATARPVPGDRFIDDGAGVADLVAAERALKSFPAQALMRARVVGAPGPAVFRVKTPGVAIDSLAVVEVEGGFPGPVRLTSESPWLVVPNMLQHQPPKARFPLTLRPGLLTEPGLFSALVTGWSSDTSVGPLFRVVATVVVTSPLGDSGLTVRAALPAGGLKRIFFAADSARPFRVIASSGAKAERVLAFLHEPGGQPDRTENGKPGGFGEEAAVYDVDGRDVMAGVYEVIAVAAPAEAASAVVVVDQSPVRMDAKRVYKDSVVATVSNRSRGSVSGTVKLGVVGGERTQVFSQRGGAERRVAFHAPAWANHLVADLQMPRDAWPLFTDFGFTLEDATGQIIAKQPLNYSFGRLSADLPAATKDRELVMVLTPAFADPDAAQLWTGQLSIRLYAETPVLVEPAGPSEFTTARGGSATVAFKLPASPWALPDAFFPLGSLVIEVNGASWGREVPLPQASGPIMK
ncbi:MAG: S8 family serine peptidase [Gemmatimonadota bacterium]